jgi:hypothetical protein
MDPNLLTVYASPFPKIRIGSQHGDGGYIICDITNANYDIMIAGGVAEDVTFEEHLCSIYPNLMCYAFDGTQYCKISESVNKNIIFVKKNIGPVMDNYNTNLFPLIENGKNIFLKMDIEGAELPWLKCLNDEQMNKFSQIVIEFHFPFSQDDNQVFEKLNKNHILVHFHGNNCPAGVINHREVIIPNVFECTYINKKYVDLNTLELNKECIPGPLDKPNCGGTDIFINYPPFVHGSIALF